VSRALLLVAHGSRDADAQATAESLAELVRAELTGVDVAVGYLDHAEPSVPDALAKLLHDNDAVTVVPLLFAGGRHYDVDLPALVRRPGVVIAPPLGADPLIAAALRDRLIDADAPADAAVILVAAGSQDPSAAQVATAIAALLDEGTGWNVTATDVTVDLTELVATTRTDGASVVAVAPLLLAPGVFADRVSTKANEAYADVVATPIGAHPALALLIAKRYTNATEVAA
jgi:sirohydrochlorin ferrochelatase